MTVSDTKTATLSIRVTPKLKKAIAEAAKRERRSVSNYIEIQLEAALLDTDYGSGGVATVL